MEKINFSLALNKPYGNYRGWDLLDQGYEIKKLLDRFFIKDRRGNIEKQELDADNFKFAGVDFKALEKRQKQAIEALTVAHRCIDFYPDWRFIVGLGGASEYNTGITLHHIHGFPYIPASGIKGAVRSWYIQSQFQEAKNGEGLAIENEMFCQVFGCPEKLDLTEEGFKVYESALKDAQGKSVAHQGQIIFLDAYPLTVPQIKPDIMNVHYQPYYTDNTGATPPSDYFSPNPIPFLTVEKTKFRIYYGIKKADHQPQLDNAHDWIYQALTEHGLGAKTAVGYGYHQGTRATGTANFSSAPATEKKPPKVTPKQGLEVEVIVDEIKMGGQLILGCLPQNKLSSYRIDNAPKDLKKDDRIKANCKMQKGKLKSFTFVAKL